MLLKLLVDGGGMKPSPAVSQKLGPLGINMSKVISDVNKATMDLQGIKVPVILNIDTKTKDFTVEVGTPPTSELIKKELGLAKGSPQQKRIKVANIPIETLIKVAKTKQKSMYSETLKSSLKEVVGSCQSLGILIDTKEPRQVIQEIDSDVYDSVINAGTEIATEEKLKQLEEEFKPIQKAQEAFIQELEKKAEEKAAETAAAAASGTSTSEKPEEKKK